MTYSELERTNTKNKKCHKKAIRLFSIDQKKGTCYAEVKPAGTVYGEKLKDVVEQVAQNECHVTNLCAIREWYERSCSK